jgi:hypothetical protein
MTQLPSQPQAIIYQMSWYDSPSSKESNSNMYFLLEEDTRWGHDWTPNCRNPKEFCKIHVITVLTNTDEYLTAIENSKVHPKNDRYHCECCQQEVAYIYKVDFQQTNKPTQTVYVANRDKICFNDPRCKVNVVRVDRTNDLYRTSIENNQTMVGGFNNQIKKKNRKKNRKINIVAKAIEHKVDDEPIPEYMQVD